jgi:methylthioribose-1-phosphate isomerase
VKVGGKHFRTIWRKPDDEGAVQLIDQRFLPHEFVIEQIRTVEEMATAIREMHVRGAGLIGASAGYGMYLAALEAARQDSFDEYMTGAAIQLRSTRPTAVNLSWAIDRQLQNIAAGKTADEKVALALRTADSIADEDAEHCRMIGQHGLALIQQIAETKRNKFATANPPSGGTVNVLTHCNAGWLAFVDYGSATAPIYAGHERGLSLHVWVTETRPRNQGSKLTAWELGQHGVPHTVIADSAAGHLMQRGEVDLIIVGTDRTTHTGDVANKIGTYLKALAAKANDVPFYVALPSSSIDWKMRDGLKEIPIEQRGADEVKTADGWCDGQQIAVRIAPDGSPAANYGFDVTPRELVTGLITERGVCEANEQSIRSLFPEHADGGRSSATSNECSY